MNLSNYTIDISGLDLTKLISTWTWLIGKDKEVIVITKVGDLLLKDNAGKLFMLNTGEGTIDLLSNLHTDFYKNKLPAELYVEIFRPELIQDLEDAKKILKPGQVYSFINLPALGGKYEVNNISCIDIYKHFTIVGELHKLIDNLPEEKIDSVEE